MRSPRSSSDAPKLASVHVSMAGAESSGIREASGQVKSALREREVETGVVIILASREEVQWCCLGRGTLGRDRYDMFALVDNQIRSQHFEVS